MPVAAFKQKVVLSTLADIYNRGSMNMVHNKFVDYSSMLRNKEVVEIPEIGLLSTQTPQDGAGDDVQGLSAQQVAPTGLELRADQSEAVFILEEDQRTAEYLDGDRSFYKAVTEQSFEQLMNSVDENVCLFAVAEIAFDLAGTYHYNEASDDLEPKDLTRSRAALMSNDGMKRPVLFVHPFAMASIQAIPAFIPNFQLTEGGALGLPVVGSVYGVPVVESNSVPRRRTIAASASAILSGELTLTLPVGHGLTVGKPITTAGGTKNVEAAAQVTAVTATTAVVPLAEADDPTNGAVTVTVEACENPMIDTNHAWFGFQRAIPTMREVPKQDSTSTVLQMWTRWGRQARAGRVVVINSPPSG